MTALEWRAQALRALYETETADDAEPATTGLSAKARRAVAEVLEHLPALDAELEAAAENWRLARMPIVDRNVLRLGLYELRHRPETPRAVVIAEAVALAKEYSTEKSGAFVNGVLARLANGPVQPRQQTVDKVRGAARREA